MRKTCLAIALGLACVSVPALAQGQGQDQEQVQGQVERQVQDAAPANASARFIFNRVNDGFLRLDTQSGQVAFCGRHDVGWACQAVPEERAALEKEIARLHDEVVRLQDQVAGLQHEVAVLREPPPPRPPADLTPPAGKSDDAAKLREDIARARVAVENAWRRLVDMIENFQKDMMRKG